MATEYSSDGMDILHNGARIYIRRTDSPVEKYRIQVYKGQKFYQSFEAGTLEHAQQVAIFNADLMDVTHLWRVDTDDDSTLKDSQGRFYTGHYEYVNGQYWYEVAELGGKTVLTQEAPQYETVDLICPQCCHMEEVTTKELALSDGKITCVHHDVVMVTLGDFDHLVELMQVHPDDYEVGVES